MLSQFGKIHLINWEKKEQTFEFWSEAFNFRDAGQNTVFEQLALFAPHVLSLPFSNAAVERVFSQMNIVKTNLRNKMGLKSLNAILSIRLDFKMFNYLLYTKDILLNFIDMDYDVMANVAIIMKFQTNTLL